MTLTAFVITVVKQEGDLSTCSIMLKAILYIKLQLSVTSIEEMEMLKSWWKDLDNYDFIEMFGPPSEFKFPVLKRERFPTHLTRILLCNSNEMARDPVSGIEIPREYNVYPFQGKILAVNIFLFKRSGILCYYLKKKNHANGK